MLTNFTTCFLPIEKRFRIEFLFYFRWAQTQNYGVIPNPSFVNGFMAQGYDIGDPYNGKNFYLLNNIATVHNALRLNSVCRPAGRNNSHRL